MFSFPLATEMFHFTRSSPFKLAQEQYFDFIRNGFPHSEIHGSKVAWDLTEAYRTLQRPSSSNSVKASTVRPYLSAHYENTKLCFLDVKTKSRQEFDFD